MKEFKPETKYYKSFEDDFVESMDQDYKLKENYKWIHTNPIYRFFSWVIYGIAWVIIRFAFPIAYGIKVKNRKVIKPYKKMGYFYFGNHTQMLGDVFKAPYVAKSKRVYVIAAPANLGVPVIGRILTSLGAITIPTDFEHMKDFTNAIHTRIEQKHCVSIYPEAHLWPYYTGIRPFPETSFKFVVNENAPAFCITTTYQKRKHRKKPRVTLFVDGPFWPDKTLSRNDRAKKLHDEIYQTMLERSKESTYDYVIYKKSEDE